MKLRPHQAEVLDRLKDGSVLWGGVGSGKSIVALAWYMDNCVDKDIVVITTAKKRDSLEWRRDAAKFGIGPTRDSTVAGTITVDSWNNIGKYVGCEDTFVIFDEQRLVGNGVWVKSFLKIVAEPSNSWLLLTATPGDTWMDYIPLFIAKGYYKNPTDFKRQHVVYRPYVKFPQVDHYININKLERLKQNVLVEMPYLSASTRVLVDVSVAFDKELMKVVSEKRWNPYEDRPIKDAAEMFALMRKVVFSDRSRLKAVRNLMEKHDKLIIFYNFNYELDILRELNDTWSDMFQVAEWNGHKKEPIPKTDKWVYLVQYMAGAEGWNCTETDAMIFYSMTYSYKMYEQAQGRIDRLNTPFKTLYYYSLLSNSVVDRAISGALGQKRTFNERKWMEQNLPQFEVFEEWDSPLAQKYAA